MLDIRDSWCLSRCFNTFQHMKQSVMSNRDFMYAFDETVLQEVFVIYYYIPEIGKWAVFEMTRKLAPIQGGFDQ